MKQRTMILLGALAVGVVVVLVRPESWKEVLLLVGGIAGLKALG